MLLSLFSCENSDNVNNTKYQDYLNKNLITERIEFSPLERVQLINSVTILQLQIEFHTIKTYSSASTRIATTQFIQENELIVRLDSIYLPSRFVNMEGPASGFIDLPENITKLTFINGHFIDKYNIDITDEKVSVSVLTHSFSTVKNKTIFRD